MKIKIIVKNKYMYDFPLPGYEHEVKQRNKQKISFNAENR